MSIHGGIGENVVTEPHGGKLPTVRAVTPRMSESRTCNIEQKKADAREHARRGSACAEVGSRRRQPMGLAVRRVVNAAGWPVKESQGASGCWRRAAFRSGCWFHGHTQLAQIHSAVCILLIYAIVCRYI